jgi:hypothetical protein
MKITKTAFYLSVSVVIALIGLVLLFAFQQKASIVSIATSIIAAGITSIAFGFNQFLEERDDENSLHVLRIPIKELGDDLNRLDRNLQDVRNLVEVISESNKRRIFERHPDDEFKEELKQLHRNSTVYVDSLGLTLKPFCNDHLNRFVRRGNSVVRVLIQNPLEATFSMICDQEGRDEKRMALEVLQVTQQILSLKIHGVGTQVSVSSKTLKGMQIGKPTIIELKWFNGFPSVTLTRLNHVVFVRARYLNEANEAPSFFERYYEIEGMPFDAYNRYFDLAWNAATIPTDEMRAQLESKLKQ